MDIERREFRVMGSDATVVVADGPPGLADEAQRRLNELEALWSRFRPDSEISLLNAAGGAPMEVSPETLLLVQRALEAWRLTEGACDPTVLGDVLRAGYTVTFDRLPALPVLDAAIGAIAGVELRTGAGGIRIDEAARTVALPRGVGFDPGGIGKGLAADMMVAELLAAGAGGACVNVGGDLRVAGRGPAADPGNPAPDAGWLIGVDDPFNDTAKDPVVLLGIGNGGVATSSRLRRRWTAADGRASHHLINPATGRPASNGLAAVTVVAGEAWRAEMLTKAVFLAGLEAGSVLLEEHTAAGILFTDDGAIRTTMHLAPFIVPMGGTVSAPESVLPREEVAP
jgi:thiamine biosynthesis lipoprotein